MGIALCCPIDALSSDEIVRTDDDRSDQNVAVCTGSSDSGARYQKIFTRGGTVMVWGCRYLYQEYTTPTAVPVLSYDKCHK